MKIAVISDIHGNIDALEAVVEDIDNEGCEKVFVLGDYAMAGAEPAQVIDWFMEKQSNKNYKMIQGNTDLMITDYSPELYNMVKEKAPIMAEALKNNVQEINSKQKEFLQNLPAQLEIEESGIKFLLVHGSPRRNNEDISPNLELEKVEEMLENVDADVILCGHTHLPCGYQTRKKQTVVNVGSIGRPFTENAKPCYLKITLNNGKALFEHRYVDYDNQKASKRMLEKKFNGAEKLAEMLINPTVRHF